MRIAATAATLLFALASCSTTEQKTSPYQEPNSLMRAEISQRIEQIPYQHNDELVQNLMWLAQTGEQTIPGLLEGLEHENAKVRSSCIWVLGRMRDRRTIPNIQPLVDDRDNAVRMEAARTLVLMGDMDHTPKLIEGLDSERKEVRFLCHEALKASTGHDFGYDHLTRDQRELQVAVLRWRQWWGEYSGDRYFAQSYERANGLDRAAAPAGEIKTPNTEANTDTQPSGDEPGATDQPKDNGAATSNESTSETTEQQAAEAPAAEKPVTTENPQPTPAENAQPTPVKNSLPTPVQPAGAQPATEQPKKQSKVIELPVVDLPKSGASKPAPTTQPAGNGGQR